jgi:hypothetical protein
MALTQSQTPVAVDVRAWLARRRSYGVTDATLAALGALPGGGSLQELSLRQCPRVESVRASQSDSVPCPGGPGGPRVQQ